MPKIMQPGMREQPGLGALTAAQVLLRFSHAGRIHSEAAFAMLLSTAPVPASSGRHRLAPAGTGRHRRVSREALVAFLQRHGMPLGPLAPSLGR